MQLMSNAVRGVKQNANATPAGCVDSVDQREKPWLNVFVCVVVCAIAGAKCGECHRSSERVRARDGQSVPHEPQGRAEDQGSGYRARRHRGGGR